MQYNLFSTNLHVLSEYKSNEYHLRLPHKKDLIDSITLKNNSLIIIGANGSGKSRLGAWIEKDDKRVHRIGGQRSLVFEEYIEQKSYEQSARLLMYGSDKPSSSDKPHRWKWDGTKYNYTSSMLDDSKYAFSAFLAKDSLQRHDYIEECKQREQKGLSHNPVPEMQADKLIKIWQSVFPHRDIQIKDAKLTAKFNNREYSATDMSDGERVVLYLIAQALAVPKNKIMIIDEPELHLHRSIMNKLWAAIEKERTDCLFIYITHDTQFAAQHIGAKKIWVKSYDGNLWDWDFIEDSQLPEQLLLDLLGNRQPVIFVEGKIDTELFSLIFKDFYIIPCGGCDEVITRTKAIRETAQLHELECYGIIDRDYKPECEIKKLRKDNIYALEVAEVENLFLVPEVLKIVGKAMSFTSDKASERLTEVQNYIIERFKNEMNSQILSAVISQIKYELSIIDLSPKVDDIKNKLDNITETIGYSKLYQEKSELFNKALKDQDYKEILKIFNSKNLVKCIGHYLDINNDKFSDYVIRNATNGELADEFLDAISLYTPKADIMRAHQDALNSARKSEVISVNDSQA